MENNEALAMLFLMEVDLDYAKHANLNLDCTDGCTRITKCSCDCDESFCVIHI